MNKVCINISKAEQRFNTDIIGKLLKFNKSGGFCAYKCLIIYQYYHCYSIINTCMDLLILITFL